MYKLRYLTINQELDEENVPTFEDFKGKLAFIEDSNEDGVWYLFAFASEIFIHQYINTDCFKSDRYNIEEVEDYSLFVFNSYIEAYDAAIDIRDEIAAQLTQLN